MMDDVGATRQGRGVRAANKNPDRRIKTDVCSGKLAERERRGGKLKDTLCKRMPT